MLLCLRHCLPISGGIALETRPFPRYFGLSCPSGRTSPVRVACPHRGLRFTLEQLPQPPHVVDQIHHADLHWAAAGFKDTLLRCSMKREVFYGYEKTIQPGIQA